VQFGGFLETGSGAFPWSGASGRSASQPTRRSKTP
jgi:hypothetical protein